MAKIDLFNFIKGAKEKIDLIDIQGPIMELAEKLMAQDGLTDTKRQKLARLRAYLDIHFKGND